MPSERRSHAEPGKAPGRAENAREGPLERAVFFLAPKPAQRAEARKALGALAQSYRANLDKDRATPKPSEIAEELGEIGRLARALRTTLAQSHQATKAAIIGAWPLLEPAPDERVDWIRRDSHHQAALADLERWVERLEKAARDSPQGRRKAPHRDYHGTPKGRLAHHGAVIFERFRPGELSRDRGPFLDMLEAAALAASDREADHEGLHRAVRAAVPLVRRLSALRREAREAREAGDGEREERALDARRDTALELWAL